MDSFDGSLGAAQEEVAGGMPCWFRPVSGAVVLLYTLMGVNLRVLWDVASWFYNTLTARIVSSLNVSLAPLAYR